MINHTNKMKLEDIKDWLTEITSHELKRVRRVSLDIIRLLLEIYQGTLKSKKEAIEYSSNMGQGNQAQAEYEKSVGLIEILKEFIKKQFDILSDGDDDIPELITPIESKSTIIPPDQKLDLLPKIEEEKEEPLKSTVETPLGKIKVKIPTSEIKKRRKRRTKKTKIKN